MQVISGTDRIKTKVSTINMHGINFCEPIYNILHNLHKLRPRRRNPLYGIIAIRTLKVMYPFMLGIGCFSHTMNCVDERFNAPHVLDFTTYWISLFSHSFKAKSLWKEQTARAIGSYSVTRWLSKWDQR